MSKRQTSRGTPQAQMLADFLRATTPSEKRKVIETFAPHYFIFGNKLDPRNPYERKDDEQQ